MVCSQCQTSNPDYHSYCYACGRRVAVAVRPAPAPQPATSDDEAQVEALLEEAFLALESGDFDAAINAAQTALALAPDSESAHSVLGLIYERQDRKDEAIRQFEIVLALDPSSEAEREKLAALHNRGRISFLWRRWGSPASPFAIGGVAVLLLVLGGGFIASRWPQSDRTTASAPAPSPSGSLAARGTVTPSGAVAGVLPRVGSPVAQFASTGVSAGRPRALFLPPSLPPTTGLGLPLPPAQVGGVVPIESLPSGIGENDPARPALPRELPDPAPPSAQEAEVLVGGASGFIRIKPEGEAAVVGGSGESSGGQGATIKVKVAPAPEELSILGEARTHQKTALRAWRKRNLRVAEAEYEYTRRLLRSIVSRGGSEAKEAGERLKRIGEMLALIRQR